MIGLVENVLDSITSRACVDVFAARRLLLRELPGAPESVMPADQNETMVAAVVGFTGLDMRGSLVLKTAFDVIAAARPAVLSHNGVSTNSWSDWVMVRDWAGELCNQTLGRIKNNLRSYGVIVEIGLPTVFSGRAISFAKPKSGSARSFTYEALGRRVWLCLDATFSTDFMLMNAADESAKEGDVILF